MDEPIYNRMEYDKFTKMYKGDIVDYISTRPLISPYD